MIRILIADDHPIIRKRLAQILSDKDEIVISGEACNGREALEAYREHYDRIDMIISDMVMPKMSELEVTVQGGSGARGRGSGKKTSV